MTTTLKPILGTVPVEPDGSAHFLVDREEANRYAEHFLNVLGIKGDDIGDLQPLTMEQILETYIKSLPIPRGIRSPMVVVDGEVFHELPVDSVKAGSAGSIPLMAGTTADEWRLWQVMDPALEKLSEGHMFARFRRMMPDWDIGDTVKEYQRLLPERTLAEEEGENS